MSVVHIPPQNPGAAATARDGAAADQASGSNADGFGFGDLIDVINPLQHIPIVSTIYREITGDEISPMARLAGAGLYAFAPFIGGGPLGFASEVANVAVEGLTGADIAGNVMNLVLGEDSAPAAGDPTTTADPTAGGAGFADGAPRAPGTPLAEAMGGADGVGQGLTMVGPMLAGRGALAADLNQSLLAFSARTAVAEHTPLDNEDNTASALFGGRAQDESAPLRGDVSPERLALIAPGVMGYALDAARREHAPGVTSQDLQTAAGQTASGAPGGGALGAASFVAAQVRAELASRVGAPTPAAALQRFAPAAAA